MPALEESFGPIELWLFDDEIECIGSAIEVVRSVAKDANVKVQIRESLRLRWPPLFDRVTATPRQVPPSTPPSIVVLDIFEGDEPRGIDVYRGIRNMPDGGMVPIVLWATTMADVRAEQVFLNNGDSFLSACRQKTRAELRARLFECALRLREDASTGHPTTLPAP